MPFLACGGLGCRVSGLGRLEVLDCALHNRLGSGAYAGVLVRFGIRSAADTRYTK